MKVSKKDLKRISKVSKMLPEDYEKVISYEIHKGSDILKEEVNWVNPETMKLEKLTAEKYISMLKDDSIDPKCRYKVPNGMIKKIDHRKKMKKIIQKTGDYNDILGYCSSYMNDELKKEFGLEDVTV